MKKFYYKLYENLIFVAVVFIGVLLIVFRQAVSQGIRNALALCGEVLIPSLLPFMLLSSFAVNSDADRVLLSVVKPFMKKLFRLPAVCFKVVLFGFIGGYPVGMSLAAKMYEKGILSDGDVKHIASFCVNAGPAFTVMIAGGAVAGSRKGGVVILASTVVSSLVTGIVYSFFKKESESMTATPAERNGISESLVKAVVSSQESILSVCFWVMAFSVVLSVAEVFITDEKVFLWFSAFAEVTNGVQSAMRVSGLCAVAAAVSFGGLSVMCQLMPLMKKCGIKASFYLKFRIVNSVLSYFLTKLILCFVTVDVQAHSAETALSGTNAPASAALLIMGAVFIYNVQRNQSFSTI